MHQSPPLSAEAVREIVRLYVDGQTITELAAQFRRSPPVINNIVHGKSYRHITSPQAHQGRKCDTCADCVKERRREQNAAIGDAATLIGVCMHCGEPALVKATLLLSRPGLVRCEEHRSRARRPATSTATARSTGVIRG